MSKSQAQEYSFKHQIGIGLPKFVNHLFPKDANSYLINYRYNSLKTINLRTGFDFSFSSKEDDIQNHAFRLGIDVYLKRFPKWDLYGGLDINYSFSEDKLLKTVTFRTGPTILFGIMYRFSENFSISTEPNLFIAYNFFTDLDSFDLDEKNRKWTDIGIGGVGFLNLNFHF